MAMNDDHIAEGVLCGSCFTQIHMRYGMIGNTYECSGDGGNVIGGDGG